MGVIKYILTDVCMSLLILLCFFLYRLSVGILAGFDVLLWNLEISGLLLALLTEL
jgi:hypothetical protein